jgi:hypothetical protein
MKKYVAIMCMSLGASTVFGSSGAMSEESCSSYPYSRGSDVFPVEGSIIPKMISTQRAVPFSEDLDDVDDAYDEARELALTEFSRFMNDLVSSERRIDETVAKLTKQSGNNQQKEKTELKEIFKSMGGSSSALLRGVQVLGSCYTPNLEVRVTVGLKPETVEAATGMAAGLRDSFQAAPTLKSEPGSPTNNSPARSSNEDNIRRQPGYSDTRRLKDF